jgi:hypothetical protein
MHSKALHWAGWILTAIGLIDLPDQLQRWSKFFGSFVGVAVKWETDWFGNTARWTIFGLGIVLLLYSYDVPQRLAPKFGWKFRRLDKALSSHGEETVLDRFHNRRTIPLRIEFSDTSEFKHVGESTGHGLQQGHWQSYRVAIRNNTDKDIEHAQVWLTQIDPMPSELMGNIPLPLHVTHESDNINATRLSANEKRLVDVVSFFDRFWHCNIKIHHTSTAVKTNVYQGDDGYEIELTANGKDVPSSRRRFKIGVNERELFMQSLDQSEEDAFQEGFDAPHT